MPSMNLAMNEPDEALFPSLLTWIKWRTSPLGRAASSFRTRRYDYYLYLGQLLKDSNGKKTMLDIFMKDAARYEGKPRGVLNQHWAEQHQDGADLMKTWGGTLPAEDLMVIGAATQAGGPGAVEDALMDASRLAKRAELTKSQFVSTIAIGFIAISLALAVIIGLPIFFVPLLQKSFSFVPADMWGPKGKSLVSFALFVKTWWPMLLGSVGVAIAATVVAMPRWTGPVRAKVDKWFLPYRLYRDARAAEFLATLGAVLKKRGNVSLNLREGLELIRSRANRWLSDHCTRMLAILDEPGSHNGADVLDSGLLSTDNVYYVADMMEALGPDEGLQVAGLRIEKEIEQSIDVAGKRLRVIMMVSGVSVVFAMASWMGLVIGELKTATALVFT